MENIMPEQLKRFEEQIKIFEEKLKGFDEIINEVYFLTDPTKTEPVTTKLKEQLEKIDTSWDKAKKQLGL